MSFFTYIMASRRNGTLYTGSTDDLTKRYFQHRDGYGSEFTAKYAVKVLVWFEVHGSREAAFARERRIKEWRRSWKILLIEELNPNWRDLGETFEHEVACRIDDAAAARAVRVQHRPLPISRSSRRMPGPR